MREIVGVLSKYGLSSVQDSVELAADTAKCGVTLFGCDLGASTLFAAVSAAAAAVSALFLYLSARASIKSNVNEKRLSQAQVRHKYYDKMVISRVLPALDRFRKDSKRIIEEGKREIDDMHRYDASSNEMHNKVREVGDDFQDVRSSAVNEVSEYLDAWGNNKLRQSVREVAESMEDEIAPMFQNLIHRDSEDPDIESRINEKTGEIERIIRNNDPFLSKFDDKS